MRFSPLCLAACAAIGAGCGDGERTPDRPAEPKPPAPTVRAQPVGPASGPVLALAWNRQSSMPGAAGGELELVVAGRPRPRRNMRHVISVSVRIDETTQIDADGGCVRPTGETDRRTRRPIRLLLEKPLAPGRHTIRVSSELLDCPDGRRPLDGPTQRFVLTVER